MKNDSLLSIGLPPQFSGAIIVGVNCKVNQPVFDLQPRQPIQYLTRQQVANLLKVDLRSVYTYCKTGKLKSVRFGHRVFFNSHDLIQSLRLNFR